MNEWKTLAQLPRILLQFQNAIDEASCYSPRFGSTVMIPSFNSTPIGLCMLEQQRSMQVLWRFAEKMKMKSWENCTILDLDLFEWGVNDEFSYD